MGAPPLALPQVAETILPGWMVIPAAGIMLLVIARHVMLVQTSDLEPIRKWIRISNGILMMLVATMLAYALGMLPVVVDAGAHPGDARAFVTVWVIILALLSVIVMLAIADALGTARFGVQQRRALRAELRRKLAQASPESAKAGNTSQAGGASDRAR